jgi:23S rRNA (adenine2503-C2)-methyltransferase
MRFYDILKKNNINVTVRREFGSEVDAACGQLRATN